MIRRVAYLSMHTSPLLQPGVGDAGGMNVYLDELAHTMVERSVEVEVFTRRVDPGLPEVVEVVPGYRVHHVDAGPPETVAVRSLARYVREFADRCGDVLEEIPPDILHSHYWLSGWAGLVLKRRLGIPLANSFHTLGRVKDATRRKDEPPSPLLRIAAEHEVIEGSDCVVASTPLEAEDLMAHYGADPARLCTSPPGVDHDRFGPGDRDEARVRLGWDAGPTVLFVGRIQALKGADVALETLGMLRGRVPEARMVMVGGASGPDGTAEVERLRRRAAAADVAGAVEFVDPVPHDVLVDYYRGADALVLPSRSESFGLVAAEAQASGLPVVAARVGGLVHVVDDGATGVLVDGWDPVGYAAALEKVLTDPGLAASMSAAAVVWSERFSWEATANRLLELYDGVVRRVGGG
ncbi:MAG: glycosyltransferase [Acidimicrobiia bacterium]|jgi:D-inositol-3-phosphate glycosyltransferase